MATAVATQQGLEGEVVTFFADVREKAIIMEGDEQCNGKTKELFHEMGLPAGLLPLKDIVEGGWVEESGFSWTVTRRQQEHHFDKADRLCSYDQVVTSIISKNRMTDIHGVKAKELGIWVPVSEILVDDSNPNDKKIIFKSILGLSRTMAFNLFE